MKIDRRWAVLLVVLVLFAVGFAWLDPTRSLPVGDRAKRLWAEYDGGVLVTCVEVDAHQYLVFGHGGVVHKADCPH